MATLNFGDHLTNFLELMGTIKRTFQTVKVMFITHETILKDDFYIVATLFRMVTTLFQHCNAVLRLKSSLRIVPCNITSSVNIEQRVNLTLCPPPPPPAQVEYDARFEVNGSQISPSFSNLRGAGATVPTNCGKVCEFPCLGTR